MLFCVVRSLEISGAKDVDVHQLSIVHHDPMLAAETGHGSGLGHATEGQKGRDRHAGSGPSSGFAVVRAHMDCLSQAML